MTLLPSFVTSPSSPKKNHALTIVIIGASGGVGGALLKLLIGDEAVTKVYALSRTTPALSDEEHNSHKLSYLNANISDEESLSKAAHLIAQDSVVLDIVLVTTGLLHNPQQSLVPEKALQQLNSEHFLELMRVNAMGPTLVAKYFLPLIRKTGRSYMGVLSARVGSISDNRLGGWHSYRASKAALNMLIKNIAIEYQRKNPEFIITGLHPGTVNTALSEPFQKNVKPEKLFTPEQSAGYLLAVIDKLQASDSGQCFAWDGEPIPA